MWPSLIKPTYSFLLLVFASPLFSYGDDQVGSGEPPSLNDVLVDSPRFVVKLPDKNLLCFAIDGFELFTYNLITSRYLVVNGFLNLTKYLHKDKPGPSKKKGFTEVGVTIRSIDKKVRGSTRTFRHMVSGPKKRAFLEKFGEVDLQQGSVVFGLDQEGHSSIESEQAKHETFELKLEKPKVTVKVISGDRNSFNIYVENSSGLISSGSHGLIGKYIRLACAYEVFPRPSPSLVWPIILSIAWIIYCTLSSVLATVVDIPHNHVIVGTWSVHHHHPLDIHLL